jgi:hypothetical protein
MSNQDLRTQVCEFLDRSFPGSTLDDGYFFVRIEAANSRRVRRESMSAVFDRLIDRPCWLVSVNNDPRDFVESPRLEQGTTDYAPDWNYTEPVPQWFVELPIRARVDLEGFKRRMKPLGALAVFCPDQRLIFDVHYMRLHAASNEDLERFVEGHDGWFEAEAGS